MGRANNQMVTYVDLQWLVDNEGFVLKNEFPGTSLNCPTKVQCSAALNLKEDAAEWIAWEDNRLVPYRLLISSDITYQGAGAYCVQDDPPVDNPPTAPTIIAINVTDTSITVDWTNGQSTDDDAVTGYYIEYSEDGGTTWSLPNYVGSNTSKLYTGLTPSYTYRYRVYAVDTAPQNGPYSNELIQATDAAPPTGVDLDLSVYDENTSADRQNVNLVAPAGDQITIRITINTGSTGTCSRNWRYDRILPSTDNIAMGNTLPALPITYDFVVTGTGSSQQVAYAAATRAGVGFVATTTATAEVLSTDGSDPNGVVGVQHAMNINATGGTC